MPINVLKYMVLREYYKELYLKRQETEAVIDTDRKHGASGSVVDDDEIEEEMRRKQEQKEKERLREEARLREREKRIEEERLMQIEIEKKKEEARQKQLDKERKARESEVAPEIAAGFAIADNFGDEGFGMMGPPPSMKKVEAKSDAKKDETKKEEAKKEEAKKEEAKKEEAKKEEAKKEEEKKQAEPTGEKPADANNLIMEEKKEIDTIDLEVQKNQSMERQGTIGRMVSLDKGSEYGSGSERDESRARDTMKGSIYLGSMVLSEGKPEGDKKAEDEEKEQKIKEFIEAKNEARERASLYFDNIGIMLCFF